MVAKRIRRTRYYVVATQQEECCDTWRWEIRLKWKPVGLASEGGYLSRQEAEAAGKMVLEDLLNRLALES
jgi:hypothetical protein